MKLKATISLPGEHFSPDQRLTLARLVIVTNSPELHNRVYQEVLRPNLRVAESFGPAEYFSQLSDRMTRTNDCRIGVDVTLSGISVTARRAQKDFWDGLEGLHRIYREVIMEHLSSGLSAQLFTRMALDAHVSYLDHFGSTSLLEQGPEIIEGKALIETASLAQVVRTELVALLGDERTLSEFATLFRQGEQELTAFQGLQPERLG